MRIAIIGYSGAGKSTLARALGERYACPVLHLDALHFLPGWKERGDGDALSLLLPRLQEKSWVIDGNYGSLAYWERMELADQIIFFNFNRFQCLWQAYDRYRRNRGQVRGSMAPGCMEKFDLEFLLWILWNGRRKRLRNRYRQVAPGLSPQIYSLPEPPGRPAADGGSPVMSGFSRRLYALVRQIPPGQVATYGQLALLLGNPRMSGRWGLPLSACRDDSVPCHRVVSPSGRPVKCLCPLWPGESPAPAGAGGRPLHPGGLRGPVPVPLAWTGMRANLTSSLQFALSQQFRQG